MEKFGSMGQVFFETEHDFYFTLGFLAQSRYTKIRWEKNEEQGAWGSEGRIICYGNTVAYPLPLKRAFTAGVGTIKHRVNCNEYVQRLSDVHNFEIGDNQDVDSIRKTVPESYLQNFDNGRDLIV